MEAGSKDVVSAAREGGFFMGNVPVRVSAFACRQTGPSEADARHGEHTRCRGALSERAFFRD